MLLLPLLLPVIPLPHISPLFTVPPSILCSPTCRRSLVRACPFTTHRTFRPLAPTFCSTRYNGSRGSFRSSLFLISCRRHSSRPMLVLSHCSCASWTQPLQASSPFRQPPRSPAYFSAPVTRLCFYFGSSNINLHSRRPHGHVVLPLVYLILSPLPSSCL